MLVNDWSARDIQRFEYRPLGPFLGKSFATSIAGWITPLAALEPYLVPAVPQDPEPAEYLRVGRRLGARHRARGRAQRRGDHARQRARALLDVPAAARARDRQRRRGAPGDLFASGTISGFEPGTEGSLLESGRGFLADGDTVVLRGSAGSIELGEVRGTIAG